MFEIKSPAIAFSAQWYLARAKINSPKIATIVEIGVNTNPFVAANFSINVFKIFIETAGNAICPGAGRVINWALDKFKGNAGIHFLIIFRGALNADGRVNINTLYPKETTGEIKITGSIEITVEFKAWAKAGVAYLSVDGIVKADVKTSITGGAKAGADKEGIYVSPIAEFAGIKATFEAAGTVKFGVFKRTLKYESPPCVLVEPDEIKFKKYYI